jgi:hypothetical protein
LGPSARSILNQRNRTVPRSALLALTFSAAKFGGWVAEVANAVDSAHPGVG